MSGKNHGTRSEAGIVRDIIWRMKRVPNSWHRKNHGSAYGRAGVPDIEFIVHGMAFFFEVKRPGELPTPLQTIEMDKLRRAGARVAVIHSAAEASAELAKFGVKLP